MCLNAQPTQPVLTIDPRNTVVYRDVEYPMPRGLAPYRPGICGTQEIAALLVARLGHSRGHRVEGARYIEEEPRRAGGGAVHDDRGSKAMRVECTADGHAVAWRLDRIAAETARTVPDWTVHVDGHEHLVTFHHALRAHERYARLVWTASRELRRL